jgi:hypothetical protein
VAALFQSVGRAIAFALGKTFAKSHSAPEDNAAARRSPDREMKQYPRPESTPNSQAAREPSARLKPQDKKAS